jgi:hypothetical protein
VNRTRRVAGPRRRSDYDLRVAPWLKAVDDYALQEAIIRLTCTASGARYHIDRRELETIDSAANEVLDAVRDGSLRGAKARRKVEAVEKRYHRAVDRQRVDCPTCGTRVLRRRLRMLPVPRSSRARADVHR